MTFNSDIVSKTGDQQAFFVPDTFVILRFTSLRISNHFRCDVCNYSTTTKGNLSIHMQSDKHINNIQELQGSASGSASNITTSTTLAHKVSRSQGTYFWQHPIYKASSFFVGWVFYMCPWYLKSVYYDTDLSFGGSIIEWRNLATSEKLHWSEVALKLLLKVLRYKHFQRIVF